MLFGGCDDSQIQGDDPIVGNGVQATAEAKYYWYEGKKIYLEEVPGKQYIVFNKVGLKKLSTLKSSNSSSISSGGFNELKLSGIVLSEKAFAEKASRLWGIVESNLKTVNDVDTTEIIYKSPFYKSSLNGEIGISHLFYVKLKSDSDKDKLEELAKKNRVEVLGSNKFLPLWYTLSCDNKSIGDALQMANQFYETGLFAAAEPDIMTSLTLSTPNDTYFKSQWNLNGNQSINWLSASQLSQGAGIKVALIDEGVEQLHPDLANIYPVYDTHDGSWYATNIYGPHGTACAGIIGASTNNNKGIVGVASKVEIQSFASPLAPSPNITQELASGIALASNSADVISCSWGGSALTSAIIKDAIQYNASWGRNGKGVVVVFASGNDSGNVKFPANCYDEVIAVGSINKNGKRSSFSSYGTELDVVAPGEYIPTTDITGKEGYSENDYSMNFNGTSAACPHVAAVAALILSVNNNLSSKEVGDIIEKTARKVGGYTYSAVSGRPNGTWNDEVGYGLVDAYEAVMEAKRRL
jgi:subtilisin family serine protease